MHKYIFLDIDGTLFSPSLGAIPDSAMTALKKARENGHKIFLCTGRSLAEVSKYLNFDVDGFILGAGSMVYADHKCIFDHPIVPGDITRIKKMLRRHGLGYSLEGSAGAYCDHAGYESLLWYFSGGETDRNKQIEKAMENCTYLEEFGTEEDDAIYKICAFGPKWDPVYPKMEKDLEAPYVLTKTMELKDENFCIGEITDGNITKATGIRHVLDHYNAEAFDAIGVGDSDNDIPMFKICHTGIAMGNGTEGIKKAADYITTDILEDGLYNAFVYCGLID